MEPIVEIRNRKVDITSVSQKNDYSRAAMLFYVLEGCVSFCYSKRKVQLREADVLVINRGTEYTYQGTDSMILASLELTGKTFESACDGVRTYVNCDSTMGDNEKFAKMRATLRQMMLNQLFVDEDQKKYNYLVFEYYSLYYSLLETIIEHFTVGNGVNRKLSDICMDSRQIERREEIERYLNVYYNESISLENISKELFISKGYLSKYFKKVFGMTFSQYIKELRLRHAMSDLLYTDHPITQIAFDNGFSGSSFFNRSFREKYNQNPSEVREGFLKEKEDLKIQEKEKEKLNLRLSEILEMQAEPHENVQQKSSLSISVKDNQAIEKCWNSVINIGSASDILRSDMQEHILILNSYIKYQYARFWDVFSEEMLIDINGKLDGYNFMRLDQVFDILLSNNMKPFILFEPKLERINEGIDDVIVKASHKTAIDSVENWQSIMSAFFTHVIRRYGIEEVEQWRFELSFGVYHLRGMGPIESYLTLFTTMAEIVRERTNKLMIGGATLPTGELEMLRQIILGLKKRNCIPDFISMISFAYEAKERAHKYSVRSADENYLVKDIIKYKNAIEASGMPEIPLFVTEWNETVVDRNYLNDSCYRGAYIIKSLIEVNSFVPVIGYFSGSDRRAEYYDSKSLLQGGNGLLTRDSIFKPAGYAMEFMNGLAGYEIAKGDNYMVTTDNHDNYYIAAHNKKKLSYYYYKTPEAKLEKSKIPKLFEDENYLDGEVYLNDVENGTYKICIHRVNEHYGSIMNIWQELEFSEDLSRKEILYLRRICEPHLQFKTIAVTNHTLPLNIVMAPNEISLIEIKRMF